MDLRLISFHLGAKLIRRELVCLLDGMLWVEWDWMERS